MQQVATCNKTDHLSSKKMSSLVIRDARESDCDEIFAMVKELAVYEKSPEAVKTSAEQFRRDGFGPGPARFHAFVVEEQPEAAAAASVTSTTSSICSPGVSKAANAVGFALYFYVYSTWEGTSLYLEDLFVRPEYRGRGAGIELMRRLADKALSMNCARFQWQALSWNSPAIAFYKSRIGARERLEDAGKTSWLNFIMNQGEMRALCAEPVVAASGGDVDS